MIEEPVKSAIQSNVWIGSEIGLLKSVNLLKKVATNHFEKENYGKEHEICTMCWENAKKQVLFTGHKNGIIRELDVISGVYKNSHPIIDFDIKKDKIRDLEYVDDMFLHCTASGNVKMWKPSDSEAQVDIQAGNNLECMAYQSKSKLIATGGKENLLKLWDISDHKQPVFKAKNVKPDWLQLRVPVWMTNVKFLPESHKVLTTTGLHQIRVYDPKCETRRPVIETVFGEYPITACAVSERRPNQIIVGNTRGEVASFDLRKMKHMRRGYKGFAGSVRNITCHTSLPYFFSCGLDRHLKVHHEDLQKCVHKVYLKSRLNCLLVTDESLTGNNNVDDPLKRKREEKGENEEEEEIWRKMDEIDESSSDSETDDAEQNLPNKKIKKKNNN